MGTNGFFYCFISRAGFRTLLNQLVHLETQNLEINRQRLDLERDRLSFEKNFGEKILKILPKFFDDKNLKSDDDKDDEDDA